MALDRPSIVRRDFPTHRRGYDPEAVDAHLDRLATEVEALQRRAAEPATLSQQAGEQVKSIVQAAERGAQEIRESAQAEAREHVARVTEAADRLRARIEQMERDIVQVIIDLRTNVERLHRDLAALQAGVGDLSAAAPAPEPPAAEAEAGAAGAERIASRQPPAAEAGAGAERNAPQQPAAAEPQAAAPQPSAPANGDAAAARIVALDMALSGTPRAETERYIAEHYAVPDREALLDEVYAAAGSS
ncbi:MAG TPA: DivIVA domain-containing protein [Solirubrobacteraceae bacterium]